MIRYRAILAIVLCLFMYVTSTAKTRTDSIPQKSKTKIDLLHANTAHGDKRVDPDVMILGGDVRFKHEGMFMFCDSAHINNRLNTFDAFGNVRMEQGDTLFIYGDFLFYDGMSEMARLRDNVKLVNRNNVLTTDSLNYDRRINKGYYFKGGKLTDTQNVLTSDWGEYGVTSKRALFKKDVFLENQNFTLSSDTLKYNTISKVINILGPSHIVSKENTLYSEKGTYDTNTQEAFLLNRSYFKGQGQKLIGDSLYYNRMDSLGEAFGNVVMQDSANASMLKSEYAIYRENKGSALAYGRVVLVDYQEPKDSLFVHGDSIKLVSANLNTDSLWREFRIYHKVRAYRTSTQAVCDSLVFNTKDSCMTMYDNPVVWTGNQQLLGRNIKVYLKKGAIDWAHINENALTIEQLDTLKYNQLSGKEIKAYFKEGELSKVTVDGSVQVVFYPMDEKDSTFIGQNFAEGGLLDMYIENRKMKSAAFKGKANGILYPLGQAPKEQTKLQNFVWLNEIRPKSKRDIFIWKDKDEDQKIKKENRGDMVSPRKIKVKRKK